MVLRFKVYGTKIAFRIIGLQSKIGEWPVSIGEWQEFKATMRSTCANILHQGFGCQGLRWTENARMHECING
jgi:hypothetical protein